MIDKTAIIDTKAKISKNVKIGPYTVIGPNVEIDEETEIQSHVNITGNTKIGKNNKIYPFASIGNDPQDLKFQVLKLLKGPISVSESIGAPILIFSALDANLSKNSL